MNSSESPYDILSSKNLVIADQLDFTSSKVQLVLALSPCAFIAIFSFLELYFIMRYKRVKVIWNLIYTLKTLIVAVIVITNVVNIVLLRVDEARNSLLLTAEFVKLISLLIAWWLQILNKNHGIITSGVLFIFWTILFVTSIPNLIVELVADNRISVRFFNYMIYFTAIIFVIILNCFVDKNVECDNKKNGDSSSINQSSKCPEKQASFINKVFYVWYDKLTWNGFKRSIESNDIWELDEDKGTKVIVPKFEKQLYKVQRTHSGGIDRPKVSIIPAIFKAFGTEFWMAGLIRLLVMTCQFIFPLVLGLLIKYIDVGGALWEGIVYTIVLFLVSMLTAITNAQQFHRTYSVGFRGKASLISAIYRKSLKLSSIAKQNTTVGELVNLMAIDAQRFFDTLINIHIIWAGPVTIMIATIFLWQLIGVAVLFGLAVMILLIPINVLIARKLKSLQYRQMKVKDNRIKLMNEVLNGIKLIKLYAWELSFEKHITDLREKELRFIRRVAILQSVKYFFWSIAPFYVAFASFIAFVLIDEKNILTAEIAFVSMAYFNILRFPMSLFPVVITNILQIIVSAKRINNFLNSDELKPTNVMHEKSPNAITFDRTTLKWSDKTNFKLHDITFNVKKGDLVAIVGPVGSGKSSILAALIGEMEHVSGSINLDGDVAYVSQQAWIQNITLQENILFGKPLESEFYEQVVENCALRYDIDILPAGDQTEIGEKGINLSGGQKQRVSIARACYSRADVYLFDDPLSAVDSHVGKHIFEHVIGPNGILAGKTRLLVTHAISYLPYVDQIIVLDNGSITNIGNYKDLTSSSNSNSDGFIKFLKTFMESISEEEAPSGSRPEQETSDSNISVKTTSGRVPFDTTVNTSGKLISAETVQSGNVGCKIYFQYFKNVGLALCFTILLAMLLTQASSIYASIWLATWVNDPTAKDVGVRDYYIYIYSFLGLAATLFISTLLISLGCLGASRKFHGHILNTTLRLPMMFFDTTPLGRLINRFSRDIDVIDDAIPFAMRTWMLTFFLVVSIFIVIIYSTPMFLVIMLPLGLMYYFVLVLHVRTSRQVVRLESITRSPIYSHFSETIMGESTIRAYNAQDRFIKESDARLDNNQRFSYTNIVANRWIGVRLESISSLVILFAALFAVLGRDHISPAIVGLSLSYALQVTNMLNILVRTTTEIESKIVAVERIEEYGNKEKEADWETSYDSIDWPGKGDIEFRDYELRYNKTSLPVLKGLNFKIRNGEKIGIVGRTGSGKSSLTLGLFRIIEADRGEIRIDNQAIEKLGLHTLRSKLTIIPQDPFLFSGTLRLNIDPFEKYSDEEIWRALEHAHLKSFVQGLHNGLWHLVTEGGENLSVGQKQLICLTRALLRKSKILIMDEATAAIDYATDQLIQETIRTEFKDCTILTVAHRLNTIMDSDRILVLDNGNVVELDTPKNLLANEQSIFYQTVKQEKLL